MTGMVATIAAYQFSRYDPSMATNDLCPRTVARNEDICRSFELTQRSMWSSMWPFGHCAVSSLLLAPMLRAACEREYRVVIGYVIHTDTHIGGVHAWIQDEQGWIYDPTYEQFNRDRHQIVVKPAYLITHEDAGLHKPFVSLTLDGEEQARRSIKPQSTSEGWTASSIIKQLFHRLNVIQIEQD